MMLLMGPRSELAGKTPRELPAQSSSGAARESYRELLLRATIESS